MSAPVNYQRQMDDIIRRLQSRGEVPSLLLHCCCAPCSTYVLEYLSKYFHITTFYYNPNISPVEEYQHRVAELKRFSAEYPAKYPVNFLEGNYEPERYYAAVKGLEKEKEGGARCYKCFELRLGEAAKVAKELGMDYFTTTLTISPMKDADVRIGRIYDCLLENGLLEDGIFIVTADHGHKATGGHGRFSKIESDSTIAVKGKTVIPGGEMDRDVKLRDIAAISLYALGVKPTGWSFSARVPGGLFTDVKGQIRPYHGDLTDLLCGSFMWMYTNLGHPFDKWF